MLCTTDDDTGPTFRSPNCWEWKLGGKICSRTALMMIRCPHVFCPHPTHTEGLGKSPFVTVHQTALKQSKWGQAQLLAYNNPCNCSSAFLLHSEFEPDWKLILTVNKCGLPHTQWTVLTLFTANVSVELRFLEVVRCIVNISCIWS